MTAPDFKGRTLGLHTISTLTHLMGGPVRAALAELAEVVSGKRRSGGA